MGQEGVEAVRQQIDAAIAAVADFFGRFGWPLALTAILGWWAWQVLEPKWREAANRRAIRCVHAMCVVNERTGARLRTRWFMPAYLTMQWSMTAGAFHMPLTNLTATRSAGSGRRSWTLTCAGSGSSSKRRRRRRSQRGEASRSTGRAFD